MRRSFSIPAAYRRYVEAELVLVCDRLGRDADYRSDDDERIRKFAAVPDSLFDSNKRGAVLVVVEDEPGTSAEQVIEARERYIEAERRWKAQRTTREHSSL